MLRLAVLLLGLVTAHTLPALSQTTPGETSREHIADAITGERFWLAGRYDRTRVVIYFEAVKFNDSFPPGAENIAPPIAQGFFDPKALRAGSLASFQEEPGAEHFAVGAL